MVGKDAEKGREEARRQLLLYSVPQITAYLDTNFPVEERKRQKFNRRSNIVMSVLLGYAAVFACLLYCRFPATKGYGAILSLPFHIFTLVNNICNSRSGFNIAKCRALNLLLSEYASVKQVPLLIDALYAKETGIAIKGKLSTLLPMYLQSDEPPLSDRRKRELTRHLKAGFQEVGKQKEESVIDINVSFIAAVLIYFERELAQGRTVPKNVMPMLAHFAASSPNSHIPEPQWAMMKSATEECLAYARVGK
ncbi:MAG: hypothetical protein EOP06_17770 [Proteobacteria bacterium]|nr:MAG: hypothetical protein EOP06_17770 [Pseudomonadota bacterium]